MAMSKATQAHIDALNLRENQRQWKRNAAEEMYEALTAINRLRNIRNGMADLFHVVVREENGKQICIGDLIDSALRKAEGK